MYECRTGRIDYVLTKSVSRFSQNTTDCLSLVRELLSYNIPVYFEKENLDTGSMESELILSILSSMAQGESESISKNVKWTVQKCIEAGTYKFGYLPYGYKKDENGDMIIDSKEADIVRFIFKSFLCGIGTYKIAQMLQQQNIPTRKGGKWSSSTVKGILTNEKYYGAAMFQKTYTDSQFKRNANRGESDSYLATDHHEAIISKEEFDRVQNMLQMHIQERSIIKNTGKYQRKYPFSGIILCGECGDKFKRQTQSVGVAWACSTHLYHKSECSMKFIKDEAIKAAFVTMLNKLIYIYKLVLIPYYEAIRLSETDGNLHTILELKNKIERNTDRKIDLRKLRVKGVIDNVMYNQELRRIEKQNVEYREELKNLDHSTVDSTIKETEKLMHFLASADMQTVFSDEDFMAYVESIIVYSRTCIGFKLKCGLTLKKELCTGTE